MSTELENAIQSINTAADRTTKTTTFVDHLSTYDDISDVTNPNTGVTVPSLQKKTRLVAEAAFAESETQINKAVSDAELAALTAQSAANYDTEFVSGVTSAIKGKSYLYDGAMWACLNDTTETPAIGNVSWYSLANRVKEVEERLLGVGTSLYLGTGYTNGERHVVNGNVVPVGTTHLRVLIDGKTEDVRMSSFESGLVSSLTETSATIGGVAVTLHHFLNGGYQATNAKLVSITPLIGEQWFNTTDNSIHMGDGATTSGIKHINVNTLPNYLPTYTDIVYKSSESNSALDEMFNGSPLANAIGDICKTGGTTWKKVDETGPITIENYRAFDVICLLDLGLVSSIPSGSSNDTEANDAALSKAFEIASRINEAPQNPTQPQGRKFWAPSGIYYFSQPWIIQSSDFKLEGEGIQSTIFQYDNVKGSLTTDDYMVEVGITPSGTNRLRGLLFKGFSIRGDRPTAGQTYPRGVRMLDMHHWKWDQFSIYGTHKAFDTEDCWIGHMEDCVFEWNYRSADLGRQTHDCLIQRTVFGRGVLAAADGAVSSQLRVRTCWSVTFDTCDFEFADANSLTCSLLLENDCRAININGNYFETFDNYAIYIRDNSVGCKGISIKTNLFNGSSANGGIRFRADTENHSGVVISGNFVNIAPDRTFVSNQSGRVENAYVGQNALLSAGAEASPEFYGITEANKVITSLDSSYKPIANTPTFVQNDVRIENTSTYLVVAAQEFSANSGDQGIYLVSRVGTEINIVPIIALTTGSVTAEEVNGEYFMRHTKSGGQDAALIITTINLSSR